MEIIKVLAIFGGIVGVLFAVSGFFILKNKKYTHQQRDKATGAISAGTVIEGRAAIGYGVRNLAVGAILLIVVLIILGDPKNINLKLSGGLFGIVSSFIIIGLGVQGVLTGRLDYMTERRDYSAGMLPLTMRNPLKYENRMATGLRAVAFGISFALFGVGTLLLTLALATEITFFNQNGLPISVIVFGISIAILVIGRLLPNSKK